MRIDIPYAGERATVDVEDDKVDAVLEANEVEKRDEREVIKKALASPIDRPKFSDFLTDGSLFIVNDAQRPTPTARVLETVKDEIEEHDVEFIVATGSHRGPTEEELEWIFGDLYEGVKEKVHVHDAKEDEMVYHGTTSRGTEVKFNEKVCGVERVVAINTVEPHYFAGFTGGRKSLIPGVSSYETITQNHRHALEEDARTLRLEGNPVHQDMMEAFEMFDGEIFAINMTLDKDGDIHSASAGDMKKVFMEETKVAESTFAVPIDQRSEVVVVGAHPMDMNLYQSHKAIENGKLALKEGGILILLSRCPEGIGPKNFYELMASKDSPEGVIKKIEEEYKLGYHKAAKMVDLCSRSSLWAVTDLDDTTLEEVFMEPKESVQRAVDEALTKTGGKATFLLEGGIVVPILKEN
ncbi:MAG: nickel-dependent lactate racemase [Candidatus Natronoplasma sp.]